MLTRLTETRDSSKQSKRPDDHCLCPGRSGNGEGHDWRRRHPVRFVGHRRIAARYISDKQLVLVLIRVSLARNE